MRAMTKVAVVAVVVLSGCGVTSASGSGDLGASTTQRTDLENLEQVREALVAGGITCDDPPKPFEAGEDDFDLGAPPTEELVCEVDGVTVTATRWTSEAERASTMTLATAFICGFLTGEFSYVQAGSWAIGLDTESGEQVEVERPLIARIGEAVDVEPTTKQCEGSAFGTDGPGDGSVTFGPAEDPEPRTGPGSKDEPLSVGESDTLDDWDVTVTEIEVDANKQVAKLNDFNDPPENGRYLLVTFDAVYGGDTEGTPSFELNVTLSGADAVQYTDFECGATVDDFDRPTLEPGGSDTVVKCIDAPPEAIDGGVLFIEPFSSFDGEFRTYWSLP